MLVLTRKEGEKILFPEQDITITVLEVQHGKIRIGIEAPRDIKVYRKELLQRMQEFDGPGSLEPPVETIPVP